MRIHLKCDHRWLMHILVILRITRSQQRNSADNWNCKGNENTNLANSYDDWAGWEASRKKGGGTMNKNINTWLHVLSTVCEGTSRQTRGQRWFYTHPWFGTIFASRSVIWLPKVIWGQALSGCITIPVNSLLEYLIRATSLPTFPSPTATNAFGL